MGATVTAISTSPQKEADAKAMGATTFLLSTDAEVVFFLFFSC
jgi:D-arabinose 1-dehydrogenase-like Zn-dependent alcohol dehydrogenase